MPAKELTPDLLASCLNDLIKVQRQNRILYLAIVIIGFAAACALFLWSWTRSEATNMLDLARNVAPLVPSSVSVPQIAGCASRIAQYRGIKILAGISHERALRVLEQILSK
jgi:hypothetical protein